MTAVHHDRTSVLALITVAALFGCADPSGPLAPPAVEPALAANTAGPLAVESIMGLEPVLGAATNFGQAHDINDLGMVVGFAATTGDVHAVIWYPGVSAFAQDLGTLPGGSTSAAHAINEAGTVIVGSSATAGFDTHAVRWVNVNGNWIIQDLGTLPGGTSSLAFDVADDGSIVGVDNGPAGSRGFLWQNGVMTDLGPAGLVQARAVNASGQVAGNNANNHAVLWTASTGAIELGTLGGSSSFAAAMNVSGEIVGGSNNRAFLWTPRKGMVDLGTLGGPGSLASGINAAGEVVGTSHATETVEHAFLWAKGKMLDLGVLPGYSTSGASAINNENQIVGSSGGPALRATLWTVK